MLLCAAGRLRNSGFRLGRCRHLQHRGGLLRRLGDGGHGLWVGRRYRIGRRCCIGDVFLILLAVDGRNLALREFSVGANHFVRFILGAVQHFQQIGIQYTTVGKAGFITACYIVIVPVIGLFLGKKCTKFIWAAVAMALIGLYLLCITDGFSIGKGDLLVLVCAFLFSLHILVIDYFSPKVDGVKLSCIQFLTCGILSGIPALLLEHPELSSILAAWQPILYAGVMSCGVAYTLQIIGQKNMNPTVASLILSLESCISVLAGWIILRQQLSTKEILGCVIMFAAIILAQLPQKQTE